MNEPKFTSGPWKRTITTVPNVTEGYDTSPDIVNLTIGNRNIPLAALGMNSTAEMREFYGKMVANADLMAAAPKMYARLEQCADDYDAMGMIENRDRILELLAEARGESND